MIDLRSMRKILFALIILICGIIAFVSVYPVRYQAVVNEYCAEYNLPPELVYAVIHAESKFNESAESPKGAKGLMQLTKGTADWGADELELENYSYDGILEPELNIRLGCWYIAKLNEQFGGDLNLVLAAYNAGSGNVAKWLAEEKYGFDEKNPETIPFSETKNYVARVYNNIKVYQILLKFFGGSHA